MRDEEIRPNTLGGRGGRERRGGGEEVGPAGLRESGGKVEEEQCLIPNKGYANTGIVDLEKGRQRVASEWTEMRDG